MAKKWAGSVGSAKGNNMRLSGMCLSVLLMFASVPCFAQEPTESDIATMYPLSPVVTHGVSPSTPDALGYEYKGTTDRGVVRSKNEDSFWIDGANGVFFSPAIEICPRIADVDNIERTPIDDSAH